MIEDKDINCVTYDYDKPLKRQSQIYYSNVENNALVYILIVTDFDGHREYIRMVSAHCYIKIQLIVQ